MSSSGAGAGGGSKDGREKKGLGRVLSRARGLLKRGEGSTSSKRQSRQPASSQPRPITPQPRKPTAAERAAEARARYEALPGVMSHSKAELLAQRAENIKKRFDLDIDPTDWQAFAPSDTVLRVDRPIRMRIRRTCHQCNATFTSARECPVCQHSRCNQCVRHPPKMSPEERVLSRERKAAKIKHNKENAPIVPDWEFQGKEAKAAAKVAKPSKTGGPDLQYRKPRQRVRRTCHECSVLFISSSKTCGQCGHARCTDCPRDPPKKDKYPLGYPGDEFGPSSVPHFECAQCNTIYPTGAEHGTKCSNCGHEKSDASKRAKPRKVEPAPKPEVLASLQEKLNQLKLQE